MRLWAPRVDEAVVKPLVRICALTTNDVVAAGATVTDRLGGDRLKLPGPFACPGGGRGGTCQGDRGVPRPDVATPPWWRTPSGTRGARSAPSSPPLAHERGGEAAVVQAGLAPARAADVYGACLADSLATVRTLGPAD